MAGIAVDAVVGIVHQSANAVHANFWVCTITVVDAQGGPRCPADALDAHFFPAADGITSVVRQATEAIDAGFTRFAIVAAVALCEGATHAKVIRSGPAFFASSAALVVGGVAESTSAIGKAKSGGAVRIVGATGDALAAHAFSAVAVCVAAASGRGEADAHAVAGGVANFRADVTAVGGAWLADDAGVAQAYAGGTIRVDRASRDTLAVEAFAAVAVCVVSALCNGEADTEVIRCGPAFFAGVAAQAVGGVAGGTSVVGEAKSRGAVRVVDA